MTQTVKLAKLKQSEKNVRTTQPKNIPAMAASIRARGIIQNLLVTPSKPRGMFEVIAGERRFLGAMMLAEAGLWSRTAATTLPPSDCESNDPSPVRTRSASARD